MISVVPKESFLIICEDGWQNFRALSLRLASEGHDALVLVKGDPGREVKAFISKKEHAKNLFIPRPLFRGALPFVMIWFAWMCRGRVCFWSRERTVRLMKPIGRLLGLCFVRMIQTGSRYSLEDENGRPFPLASQEREKPS